MFSVGGTILNIDVLECGSRGESQRWFHIYEKGFLRFVTGTLTRLVQLSPLDGNSQVRITTLPLIHLPSL